MVEQQHRVVEELKSQLARNNSKKTRTRLEAAVSQLAELEAQVNPKQKFPNNMTCSYQASRLRGTSNSPDKPAGDPQWPPSPPPRPEQTTPGPVGLPPPSLPPRNSVTSMADLGAPLPPPRVPCQSLPPPPPSKGATRHGSAESLTSPGPPPPARRNSQVIATISQVVLIMMFFHRFPPPPLNAHQSHMVDQLQALCPWRPPSLPPPFPTLITLELVGAGSRRGTRLLQALPLLLM